MKKYIIGFILGAIIFGSIGVAASEIFASSIRYEPSWKKSNGDSITNVAEAIDELFYKSNTSESSTYIDTENSKNSKDQYTIPENVTKAYVYISDATNEYSLSFSISGTSLISSELISNSTNVDNNGTLLRSSLSIYKLILNGDPGTITISASGGSGVYRAWTSILSY